MGHGLWVQLDVLQVGTAGHLGQEVLHGAHGFKLHHLVVKVLEGEAVGPHFLLHLGGLLGIVGLFSLLNEAQHIAHAQNSACHPVRVEDLNILQLFAHTGELDGFSGNGLDRQGRAASGIAVQLGEHNGVDIQPLIKGLGGIHRILAGHGVNHQHNFIGLDGGLDVFQLFHQCLIHMQPSGGIQKNHISLAVPTGSWVPFSNTGMPSFSPQTFNC